jgi:predicted kinase
MKLFIMMIGVPASGKSTMIQKINENKDFVVLSTDNFIEAVAKMRESTYDEVFKNTIKAAEFYLQERLEQAIKDGANIIWDQTNLTYKSRKAKIAKVPEDYTRVGWTFKTPEPEEWERRLKSRPGKTIPKHILESMAKSFEEPMVPEFDFFVDSYEAYMLMHQKIKKLQEWAKKQN